MRTVPVRLGGSRLGECTLEPAAALAEAFEARLILARAIRLPAQVFGFGLSEAYLSQIEEIERDAAAGAEEYLIRVREKVKTSRPVETRVLRGFPAAAILESVAGEHIDLVMMASHARSGVIRWALGSVADRVIQGAAPVLLIRPRVAAEATLVGSGQARGWSPT